MSKEVLISQVDNCVLLTEGHVSSHGSSMETDVLLLQVVRCGTPFQFI